ncbi:MAG: AAA family ATPase [Lachnospiraceae bacterium]|nr:AAA family ATPase [Lachnospiraceae bacterium]
MNTELVVCDKVEGYFKGIVGMRSAKESFQLLYDSWRFQKVRKEQGFGEHIIKNMNFIISGARGSGKTLIAERLIEFMQKEILDTEYEIVRFSGRSLSYGFFDELLSEAAKIVLIDNIDEYILNPSIADGSKMNMVYAMSDVMKNMGTDIVLIICGGNDGIEPMLRIDFDIANHIFERINIDNYSADELWGIMQNMAEEARFHVVESCGGLVKNRVQAQSLVSDFANVSTVEKYKNDAIKKMASNYFLQNRGTSEKDLARIDENDIPFKDKSDKLQHYLDELNSLTGLEQVKKAVNEQLIRMKVALKNEQLGINKKRRQTLHMVFMGEPGTGKTTVAKILGNIYCEMGLLPNGDRDIKTVSRADLVGKYSGHTADKVKNVCEAADGGVLFVDEAYSLVNSDNDSFGHEAVDALIQEMENRRESLMVILAGYTKEMNGFLRSNSGFKSRIPAQNIVFFEDYNENELLSIFKGMLRSDGYTIDERIVSDEMLSAFIAVQSKVPGFGNARGVRNIVQRIEGVVELRINDIDERSRRDHSVRKLTKFERTLVCEEDINKVSGARLQGDKSIEELLDELNALIGLEGVKKQVSDMVRSVEYANLLKERGLANGQRVRTMHIVFSGNPGTGKSTVATLLGQIYVKLGVLKKNTFVLAKREDLVAQYQGQTAGRVAAKFAEAEGGILFIDEAYQLCIDEHDIFGMEAVGTILSLAEEKRDLLMIILAGYKEDMDSFLSTNPGLKSRFPRNIVFTDYTIEELMKIFSYMVKKENMLLGEGVEENVRKVIEVKRGKDPKEFGNARGVRNILDEIIIRQNSRIAGNKEMFEKYTNEDLMTILEEDVVDE